MKPASSSASEEDVPLKQRVKAKTQKVTKKGTKEKRKGTIIRPVQAKKFVIPRTKKTRELLDIQGLETRDSIELLRKVKQSFYQPENISAYTFEDVTIVHNARFNTEFSAKKQEMRQDGYLLKDLEDTYGYLYLDNWHKVRKLAKEGLRVDSSCASSLGDPKMGVYVSRFPDVVLPYSVPTRTSKYIMVFKIAKGKLKAVGERTGDGCSLEPTPNYDGHISKNFPPPHNVSMEQAFITSQYYFYEFSDDGEDLHARRPRQCCPYAVIQFSYTPTQSSLSSTRNVLTQDSSLRNLPSQDSLSHNVFAFSRSEKNNNNGGSLTSTKSLCDGRMYASLSKNGRTLWSGVIKNKNTILSSADLICYSSDILPITIGGNIDIKAKVSFEKLKPSLLSPIFKQLPAISTKCKAFAQRAMYLYCEIRPRDKNSAKLAKLIKLFLQKNMAGVAEFPESCAHIYIIPTSDFSHQLGLTDRHYPSMLHALILKKLPKEDIQSYKKMNRMTADPVTEAAVRRDIRKELRRIELEKLKKREQSDCSSRVSSVMDISSSDDKGEHEDPEKKRKKTDVKGKSPGAKVESALEKDAVDVAVKQNDSKSASEGKNKTSDNFSHKNETNVLSAVNEDLKKTTTSGNVLEDVENVPSKGGQQIMAVVDEVFKSPPPIQKHTAVDDDTFINVVPHGNKVTRHFMDPRLGWNKDLLTSCTSPTEVETVSSDSGANMVGPSPIVGQSRTIGTPDAETRLEETDTGDVTNAVVPQTYTIASHKDKVSRLSSRLKILFSQAAKRPTKSSANAETALFSITSTVSSGATTMSTVAESSSFVKKESHATTTGVSSSTFSSTFHSADDSKINSESAATEESVTRCTDLPNSATVFPLATTEQNSIATTSVSIDDSIVFFSKPSLEQKYATHPPIKTSAAILSWKDSDIDIVPEPTLPVPAAAYSLSSTSSFETGLSTEVAFVTETSPQFSTTASGKVKHLHSSDILACPVMTMSRTLSDTQEQTVPTTFSSRSEISTKSEQFPKFTINPYLENVLSLLNTSKTPPPSTSVSFLVSPSTSASPVSTTNASDEASASELAVRISKSEKAYSQKQQMLNLPTESTFSSDVSSRKHQKVREDAERNYVEDQKLLDNSSKRNDEIKTCDNIAPIVSDMTQSSYAVDDTVDMQPNDNVPGLATSSQTPGTSCEADSSVSILRTSPPIPTEELPPPPPPPPPLPPPPPPPPLTTSLSAGQTTTYSGSWGKDNLPYVTLTTTELGLSTYSNAHPNISSFPGVQTASFETASVQPTSFPPVQPTSQESCDLYAYALTLSPGQTVTQDGSGLCPSEENKLLSDKFRTGTPVSEDTPQSSSPVHAIETVYAASSAVPLPPPPPPPPLPVSQTHFHPIPPVYCQGNYPKTFSPFYTHPYYPIQPTPISYSSLQLPLVPYPHLQPTQNSFSHIRPSQFPYCNVQPPHIRYSNIQLTQISYSNMQHDQVAYSNIQPSYPDIQAAQIPTSNPESTSTRYHYSASENTSYPPHPPALTKELDEGGFGYTKQITTVWEQEPAPSDVQSKKEKKKDKHTSRVAKMPSGKVVAVRSTSRKDRHSSSYLKSRRDAAKYLRTREKERVSSREKRCSSSKERRKQNLDERKDLLKRKESCKSSLRKARFSGTSKQTHCGARTNAVASESGFQKESTPDSAKFIDADLSKTAESSDGVIKQNNNEKKAGSSSQVIAERQEFAAEEGSGVEQRIQRVETISTANSFASKYTDRDKQDCWKDLEYIPLSSGIEQDYKVEKDVFSNKFSGETSLAGHKDDVHVDALKQKRCDIVSAMKIDFENTSTASVQVSNLYEQHESDDKTYVKVPLSGNKTQSNKADYPQSEVKLDAGEVKFDVKSVISSVKLCDFVKSNDELYEDVPLSEANIGRTVKKDEFSDDDFPMESDTGWGVTTGGGGGGRRESIKDLRILLQERKRKLAELDELEKRDVPNRAIPRSRRRVVEIIKRDSNVPESQASNRSCDETRRKVTSFDSENNDFTPGIINVVLDNRSKVISPETESRVSSPDRCQEMEVRRVSSPDSEDNDSTSNQIVLKSKSKTGSPDSIRRVSTPDGSPTLDNTRWKMISPNSVDNDFFSDFSRNNPSLKNRNRMISPDSPESRVSSPYPSLVVSEMRRKMTSPDFENNDFIPAVSNVVLKKQRRMISSDSESRVSTPDGSHTLDELRRKMTSPDSENNDFIPTRNNIALKNKRRMDSPNSDSRVSTPDARWTRNETWRRELSPDYDMRRKLTSTTSDNRSRSPAWNHDERRPESRTDLLPRSSGIHGGRRSGGLRAESITCFQAGSSAGSRPGSSASQRAESSAGSRPGSMVDVRAETIVGSRVGSYGYTERYFSRNRSQVEDECSDRARELAHRVENENVRWTRGHDRTLEEARRLGNESPVDWTRETARRIENERTDRTHEQTRGIEDESVVDWSREQTRILENEKDDRTREQLRRVENERRDSTRERGRSRYAIRLDRNYSTSIPSDFRGRSIDEDYSTNSPAGLRRERQRSVSPIESYYSYAYERDNSSPSGRLSPDGDGNPGSRYSIQSCDAPSSSSDSSSSLRMRQKYGNTKWPRREDVPQVNPDNDRNSNWTRRQEMSGMKQLNVRNSSWSRREERSDVDPTSESNSRWSKASPTETNNWLGHGKRRDANPKMMSGIDLTDEEVLSSLANSDAIERIQRYVYGTLKRTLDERLECLDEPVEKKYSGEEKPFFGGIGKYIYADRDDEESFFQEDRNFRCDPQTSRRLGTEMRGDYHGEGSKIGDKSGMTIESCSAVGAQQNLVQKDVLNNLVKNDSVNVKQSKDSNVCKCTAREEVKVNKTSQDKVTCDVLSSGFVAEFKQKRRRVLIEKLRNLRSKEKIGSCAILLSQIEKLKRAVRRLSAAQKRRGYTVSKKKVGHEEMKKDNNKHDEVDNTREEDLHRSVRASVEGVDRKSINKHKSLETRGLDSNNNENTPEVVSTKTVGRDVRNNNNNASDGSDYNVMSMITSDSDDAADNKSPTKRTQTSCDRDLRKLVNSDVADTKKSEKENDFLQTGGENKQNQLVVESTMKNIQNEEIRGPLLLDKARKPKQVHRHRVPYFTADFDSIALQANRKFKLQLMIKAKELFPKHSPGFHDCKGQSTSTTCRSVHPEGYNRSAVSQDNVQSKTTTGVTTPKCNNLRAPRSSASTSRWDLAFIPPPQSSGQSDRSLLETDLERQLSSVLNNLTKSQLDILQSGSPKLHAREPHSKPIDSPKS